VYNLCKNLFKRSCCILQYDKKVKIVRDFGKNFVANLIYFLFDLPTTFPLSAACCGSTRWTPSRDSKFKAFNKS
jgi:hypothetical protein